MRRKKTFRVNTMYGADGRLRTSYFEGDATKVARKYVKAFEKDLRKYEKDFAAYASLDIDNEKVHNLNSKYIFDKLGIAEKYADVLSADDIADNLGSEMTVIACNKHVPKFGLKAKLTSKLQPFFERQAQKHPSLKALSDRITKAANNGRMPLTADSASMMRIAFDKKYYNDCRKPGANVETLKSQYTASIANLTKMAMNDGVEPNELHTKFAEKLISQMQVDESLTDLYAGMANGDIRLADSKPVVDANGKAMRVGGRMLYDSSSGFVSKDVDEKGRNIPLNAWGFTIREPQTIDEILQEYQAQFDKFASRCTTEADLKRMLAGTSYANIERNAKVFAEADCPDDAAMFKYEFQRHNLESCKRWGINNGNKMPYAGLVIPPPWAERTNGNDFLKQYSTDEYYSINEQTQLHDKAAKDVSEQTDEQLAITMAKDIDTQIADAAEFDKRLDTLEAESQELNAQITLFDQSTEFVEEIVEAENQPVIPEEKIMVNESEVSVVPENNGSIVRDVFAATNIALLADKIKSRIQERYGMHDATILEIDEVEEQPEFATKSPLSLMTKTETASLPEKEDDKTNEQFTDEVNSIDVDDVTPVIKEHNIDLHKTARFDNIFIDDAESKSHDDCVYEQ